MDLLAVCSVCNPSAGLVVRLARQIFFKGVLFHVKHIFFKRFPFKVFSLFICFFVLFFSFSISSFALADGWRTFSKDLSSFDGVDKLYWSQISNDYFASTSSRSLRFNTYNSSFKSLCLRLPISISVQSGDSVNISFSCSGYSHSSISQVGLYVWGTESVSSGSSTASFYSLYPVSQSSSGSFSFSVSFSHTFDRSYTLDKLVLDFTVINKVAGGYFQLNDTSISFGFGVSSDPANPAYSSPNTSGFDEYNGLDQSVQNGAQPGIDAGASLLSKFPQYLENFRGGLLLLTNMFIALVPSEVITVLSISVMLGIVGILFGLGSVAFYNSHNKPDSDIKRRDRASKIRQSNKDMKEMGQ